MTNAEIIAKILAEIARLHAEHSSRYEIDEAGLVLERLEDFISDLETSLPAKVSDSNGLETEAVSYCFDNGLNISPRVATDFARYFYDLGCRRTAEKYDELEYNRQRASGSSEIPNDLAIAAESFAFKSIDDVVLYGCTLSGRRACFIAGAKWQADHTPLPEDTVLFNKGVEEGKRLMMEEAVEGEFLYTPYPTIELDDCKDYNFTDFDKVRVIVLPKED